MNWPAGIQKPGTEHNVVSSLDLLPTVCELANAKLYWDEIYGRIIEQPFGWGSSWLEVIAGWVP